MFHPYRMLIATTLSLALALCAASAARAEAPLVEQLPDPVVKLSAYSTSGIAKHEIRSRRDAQRLLNRASAEDLLDRVDLKEQYVVLFVWRGSGEDDLVVRTQTNARPAAVVFRYKLGRTRDLQFHVAAFVLQHGTPWRFNRAGPLDNPSPGPGLHEQLADSRDAWHIVKQRCGGDYEYTVRFTSWFGFGNETTIVVRDNVVTERWYRAWPPYTYLSPLDADAPGIRAPDEIVWVETGDELGSHREGAPIKTLDELYDIAADALDDPVNPEFTRFVFRTDELGVLLACYSYDTRLYDDVPFAGVRLDALRYELDFLPD